jgi:hypothetical protein
LRVHSLTLMYSAIKTSLIAVLYNGNIFHIPSAKMYLIERLFEGVYKRFRARRAPPIFQREGFRLGDRIAAINQLRKRLRELSKKVTADFSEVDGLKSEIDDIIEEYMFIGGNQPVKEIGKELELMGRLLNKAYETAQRSKEKQRSREEWAELERQFIPPEPSFVPEGYAVCGCWRCNNLFAKKGKQKYCSEECAQEQRDAQKRFKRTGTYLRPYADGYREKRMESIERMAKVKEVSLTEKLENKTSALLTPMIYGKRKQNGYYDNKLNFIQTNK